MKTIGKLFNVVYKIIGWLLLTLGLWVPVVYSFVFLLVCVFAGIPLNDAGGVFFFGLVLSLIGTAAIIVNRPVKYLRNNYKGRASGGSSGNMQEVRRKGEDVRPDYRPKDKYFGQDRKRRRLDDYFTEEEYEYEEESPKASNKPNSVNYAQNKPKKIIEPQQKFAQMQQPQYQQPIQQPYPQNGYQAYVKNNDYSYNMDGSYNIPQGGYPQAPGYHAYVKNNDYSPNMQGAYHQPTYGYDQQPPVQQPVYNQNPYFALNQDAPLIFRTRQDPSILIYEYRDRVEVYRTDGRNLELLSTTPNNY